MQIQYGESEYRLAWFGGKLSLGTKVSSTPGFNGWEFAVLPDDLARAIILADEAHDGQQDKNGEPYIGHPIRVMLSLETTIEKTVGVLHDVVADSDKVGLGDILAMFGSEVRDAVDALTRRSGESYEGFIDRCKENPIARRVKIADIKDNLRTGAPHLERRYLAALAAHNEQVAG